MSKQHWASQAELYISYLTFLEHVLCIKNLAQSALLGVHGRPSQDVRRVEPIAVLGKQHILLIQPASTADDPGESLPHG